MSENLNIYAKISKVRELSPAVKKSKSGHGYNYTPLEEILASITAGLKRWGLILYPSVVPDTGKIIPYTYTRVKYDKDGNKIETPVNEFLYTADTLWHCINIDNPDEHIEIPWFAAANMADASQTVNSANTYQARGFISAFFQMAMTEIDPEAYRSKQRAAEEAETKIITESIVDTINNLVQTGLANDPDKRDTLSEMLRKYIKINGKPSTDFTKIKSPEVATAVLTAVRELFEIETKEKEQHAE